MFEHRLKVDRRSAGVEWAKATLTESGGHSVEKTGTIVESHATTADPKRSTDVHQRCSTVEGHLRIFVLVDIDAGIDSTTEQILH